MFDQAALKDGWMARALSRASAASRYLFRWSRLSPSSWWALASPGRAEANAAAQAAASGRLPSLLRREHLPT